MEENKVSNSTHTSIEGRELIVTRVKEYGAIEGAKLTLDRLEQQLAKM
jgi:hypothetical protein